MDVMVIISIITLVFAVVGGAWWLLSAFRKEVDDMEKRAEDRYVHKELYNNDRTLFIEELRGIRDDIKEVLTNLTRRIDDVIISRKE